ncbi:MAG: carbonic anhydrase [Deltaproteobacteria bacterium]|nr:carbonic anhydrase [Deltaproteobacteria bacterium]
MFLRRCFFLAVFFFPVLANAANAESPMSPDQALQELMAGNQRFVAEKVVHPNQTELHRKDLVEGQKPFAAILGCSDSRVATDLVFDRGLGDLFVARVAGNILDDAVLGSLEYGVGVLKIPLIMVLGHESCGAVKAAIADKPLPGKIESIAKEIRQAIHGDTCDPKDQPTCATKANVHAMVERLKNSQEVIAPLVKSGKLKIVGAFYDLETGKVELTNP